jgi:quercetin dioxygenase-like cupin family protein
MEAKYLAPGQGQLVHLLGEPRLFKLTPAESGGAYLQFESRHAPGTGAPPHVHRDEDEAFYVLAGEYEFTVGDTRLRATSGAFAFVPRGTVHAFKSTGQKAGRLLITVTPGTGHEGLFREIEELTTKRGRQPPTKQLLTLAAQYGWIIVDPNS